MKNIIMDCLCRPSRIISVRIVLLDESDFVYDIKDDLPGQALLDLVFSRLNLIETAYFGIRYVDEENQTHWLDPASRISRQLKSRAEPFDLYFGVKFYAADPCKLLEEITRYQLFLQVKQDVLQGRLPVSFELAAELGAFVVQSELGDYDPRRHTNGYVSEFRLVANQTCELETRVAELHQLLKGMSPSTAELNYLDKVKWHDMYGVDLHPVLGEDSVEYFLGLTPSGVVVLRNKTTVAHYYWSRIAKVYYKGRYFMLRVCDKNNELSTYGFETPRKPACKHLSRCCIEHHAFFRLVRVAPLQSQTGTTDLFALGSRFRYSARTEKQAVKDVMTVGRTPPLFTRMPSKRQPRRVIDDLLECKAVDSNAGKAQEIKTISIPQSARSRDGTFRSTYSIPTTLGISPYTANQSTGNTPDSPRSTRSAPWPRPQQRSLFGNPSSPRSVRSASTRLSANVPATHRYRSSSVESQSSNDSRSTRRHRHRNRRTSDNESELSRGSGRSHHSHRKHRRSRHRRDSGSENDSTRARSYSGHRSSGSAELIDSNHQWKEVQRRQADGSIQSSVQQASVTKSSMVTKSHSHHSQSNDSHSADSHSHHKSRRHKKNRSPSDSRNRIWSSELAKHLQFDLVDTAGMTEDQLREIPYTVVETHSSKRSGAAGLKVHKSGSNSGSQGKDRVDRIRGSNQTENLGTTNGSIRSASTISSRECERNSGLVRMMSSMSMGDFISPSGSSLSPLDNAGLRVSHEHTDSGLGADQDYAYSSERSSDSTRYGTNKSSGASSGSHHKSTHFSGPGGHHQQQLHHSVSNRKPPVHPNRQTQQQPHLKHRPTSPAPVHNSSHSASITNHVNNNSNNNNTSYSSGGGGTTASNVAANANNNRLINHTIFANNHYTFSLNRNQSGFGSSGIGDLLFPESPSFYSAGDRVRVSRGTKSDIGVPIRRQSSTKSSSKHLANSFYMHKAKRSSVKSDLVLSYVNSSQNYSTNNAPAYHISGHNTSDFGLENYKTDTNLKILYPNSKMNRIPEYSTSSEMVTSNGESSLQQQPYYYQYQSQLKKQPSDGGGSSAIGPLVFLDQSERFAGNPSVPPAYLHPNVNSNTNNPSSEGMLSGSMSQQHHPNTNRSTTTSCTTDNCTQNRSSSLELILTPIIQSSRRAQ